MNKKTLKIPQATSYFGLIELIIGLIVSTVALTLFLKIAFQLPELQATDDMIRQFIYGFRSPFMTEVMIVFSYLGQELLYCFLIAVVFSLAQYRQWKYIKLLMAIVFSGAILNLFVKELIGRDRPIDPLFQEIFHSFPSFHAMNSFIFYSLCVLFIYSLTRNRIYTLLSFCVGVLIVLGVGISRIYLGVHYPTDILAGYIIGLWWITTFLVIDRFLTIFGLFRKST